jgi:ferredoxin-NADP reductase
VDSYKNFAFHGATIKLFATESNPDNGSSKRQVRASAPPLRRLQPNLTNESLTVLSTATLTLRVHAVRAEAEGVISLDLRAADETPLPAFDAGSHIDVHIPCGAGPKLIRQYSLCNDPAERHRYVIGVGRDPASRGGSAWLHDHARAGDELEIGMPRNHFALDESAAHTILIAGGIGITPLLAMARRLSALGRDWTLYYCVRTPLRAAFLSELQALPGMVVPVFDGVAGIAALDLRAVVAAADAGTHLYCCGPASLMRGFEDAAAARDPHTVHVEWFAPRAPSPLPADQAAGQTFEVRLARSGRSFHVPPDKTILDVLLDGGISVDYGCGGGICGACEVRVLDGVPSHQDSIFIGPDAGVTDRMMICVSRCAGAALTLDL